ncbi:MAG: glutathione peroxidase [Deltaproteobacteria bacterium]|nr:glutathione peroxidase [Deltaproteobacteria bacterium]
MANAGIGIAGGSGIVAAEGGQSDSSGETSDAAVAPVQDASDNADAAIAECLGAHQFTVESVDVGQQSLCDYQGDVLLIVNIAANCGLTALPQGFPGLVQLQTSYSGEGFKVLGVWSNQFANQMGSPTRQSQVISDFGVNFPLFAETNVNPPNEHPLFTWLKAEAGGGNVGWNFEKFLVARDGSFIKRYLSQSTPDQIVADIEAAL